MKDMYLLYEPNSVKYIIHVDTFSTQGVPNTFQHKGPSVDTRSTHAVGTPHKGPSLMQ